MMPKKKIVRITSKTSLDEILKIPGAEQVLAKYQLPCLFCPMAQYEVKFLKIGDVAKTYKLKLKDLLRELNKI